MDNGSSVFLQESSDSYDAKREAGKERREGGSGPHHDGGRKGKDECTLSITTTAADASTSSASCSPTHALKTVVVTHSPQALHHDNGHAGSAQRLAPFAVRSSCDASTTTTTAAAAAAAAAGGVHEESSAVWPQPPTEAESAVWREDPASCSRLTHETPKLSADAATSEAGGATLLSAGEAARSHLRVVPSGRSDSDTDGADHSDPASTGRQHENAEAEKAAEEEAGEAEAEEDDDDDDDEEEERLFVDEFGFVMDESERATNERLVRSINGKQVARREIKWANMTADWDRTNYKMHTKLKERCRKGIPSRLRGVAWQLLAGSRKQMNSVENAGVYVAFREKKLRDAEVDEVVSRDLTRTFPKHVLFQEEGGVGQTFLRHVLHAYAGCDPEVGYTQGMAFVVGTLSTQMTEEESFWVLHELMYGERYRMRELYRPGFPLLHQFFYQLKRLTERLLPKLHRRFVELEIEPSFYASQWFLTLFVYHFPFHAVLRIWDVFFSEGWKIVFRTGLALMKWEEKRLLTKSFDELLPALKTLAEGKDAKELIRRAHRVKFKTADLNRYGDEYWATKDALRE